MMTAKCKNLYLYLTLACFLGIILIFIFDGYLGVYDSLEMDNGQYSQTVDTDQWLQERNNYLASTGVDWDGQVEFTYTVENHLFSAYSAEVTVTFRHNDEIIGTPVAGMLTAGPFGEAEMTWVLDADAIVPADYPSEQNYNVNVLIERDGVQREVLVYVNSLPVKSVIIEPRVAP